STRARRSWARSCWAPRSGSCSRPRFLARDKRKSPAEAGLLNVRPKTRSPADAVVRVAGRVLHLVPVLLRLPPGRRPAALEVLLDLVELAGLVLRQRRALPAVAIGGLVVVELRA